MLCVGIAVTALMTSDGGALIEATVPRIDTASLARWHDILGAEPHVAGTPGDKRVIASIAESFRAMGLSVEVDTFFPYLSYPEDALVEIVSAPADAPLPAPAGAVEAAEAGESAPRRRGVMALDIREKNLAEDPTTAHPGLTYGWNAYSGSGDVTGEVVYANYGLASDFDRLRELGVDCRGKVVLIRYGGAFRAQKAQSAERAGAAAVLLYTDPADSGINRGPVYPEGGWANATCIQRGTVNPMPYPGDPLTPGVPATRHAKRLDPSQLELPRIPIQPIGYGAAREILARMRGRAVPEPAWQGGLPLEYRVVGGHGLRVRVKVKQRREIVETANVIARLEGSGEAGPLDTVIIGCHHDAWGFGAADPLAGTIVLMEVARAFSEAAAAGARPLRDILFCAWGAEEYGIIGSTEWVESRVPWLQEHAVAYINLDMAAMGTMLSAGASPGLAEAVRRAAAAVAGVSAETGSALTEREGDKHGSFRASPVAGGSDHVAFVCHAGVPSVTLASHGAEGTSYHSNYDTVAWYRQVVGEEYAGAALVSRVCAALAAELADRPAGLDDVGAMFGVAAGRLSALRQEAESVPQLAAVAKSSVWDEAQAALLAVVEQWMLMGGESGDADAQARRLEMSWLTPSGLHGREWHRHRFTAVSRDDGYAVALLPQVAEAIQDRDVDRLDAAVQSVVEVARTALRNLNGEPAQ